MVKDMTSVTSPKELVFLAEKYQYEEKHIVDHSDYPRPHFCMGYVLEGKGEFFDCNRDERIEVEPGELIFVPMMSKYMSEWEGNPTIKYISIHFILEHSDIFSAQHNFMLQKVQLDDSKKLWEEFEYILKHHKGDEASRLAALGKFYHILSILLPDLKTEKRTDIDERISRAISYMELHYKGNITIKEMAKISAMSSSRFFDKFKQSVGQTPVEYLNYYRISKAIVLLLNEKDLSVEDISESVGFESPAYFHRMFKRITGRTPGEYRKSPTEM